MSAGQAQAACPGIGRPPTNGCGWHTEAQCPPPPACWQRRASCAKLRQESPPRSGGTGSPGPRGLPLALPERCGQGGGEWNYSSQAKRGAAFQRTWLARPAHTHTHTHARAHTHTRAHKHARTHTYTSPSLLIFGEHLYRVFAWYLALSTLINIPGQPQMQEKKKILRSIPLDPTPGGTALNVSLFVLEPRDEDTSLNATVCTWLQNLPLLLT